MIRRGALQRLVLYVATALSVLDSAAAAASGGTKADATHFKWAQNKENIFLTVMVKDLDDQSVTVEVPSESELEVWAKNTAGRDHHLKLDLREDIKPDSVHWQVSEKREKWGTAIIITFGKVHQHRWDLLVMNPKKHKGAMDKDWTREDQTLEPEEEKDYLGDHEGYLKELTAKNFNKTRDKFPVLVVNVRYPWCNQCSSQDLSFAKVAKGCKSKHKKNPKLKGMGFYVLDARENQGLARWLGATCDSTCDYRIFADGQQDPVTVASKHDEALMYGEFRKFLDPPVITLKSIGEAEPLQKENHVVTGGFESESSPRYAHFKRVANNIRGEVSFGATFGKDETVKIWPHNQSFSVDYDGRMDDNGTALINWIRPRAIPLLAMWEWSMTERYEKMGVPIAKVWTDDSEGADESFKKIIRYAVRKVSKRFLGRIAFVENTKSKDSYSLREFGLNQPEHFPAFGISSNASYSAVKYAFEITPEVAKSVQAFWKDGDKAIEKLAAFCEQVLAGTWPEAHETGPVETNWTKGRPKNLVWKTFHEIEKPKIPVLLSVYGKYRQENEKKSKETENLAKALEKYSDKLVVAAYDTTDNYVHPKFERERFNSDTEWFWVPKEGLEGIDKLTKPKKDAPIKDVLKFAKQFLARGGGLELDVDALHDEFEKLMIENPPITTTPIPYGKEEGMPGGMQTFDAATGEPSEPEAPGGIELLRKQMKEGGGGLPEGMAEFEL